MTVYESSSISGRRIVIPMVNYHELFEHAGIFVPPRSAVLGDVRSLRGAEISAGAVVVSPNAQVLKHGRGVQVLMKQKISGDFNCSCEDGSGSCDVVSTETSGGDPAIQCSSDDCSGHCKMFVKVPEQDFNQLVAHSLGLSIPNDPPIIGDITSDDGALIDASELEITNSSRSRFVPITDAVAALVGGAGVQGTFNCSCTRATTATTGSCSLTVTSGAVVCSPVQGCTNCSLVMHIPGLAMIDESLAGNLV